MYEYTKYMINVYLKVKDGLYGVQARTEAKQ